MASDPSVYNALAPIPQPQNMLAQQGQIAQTASSILGVQNLLAQRAAGQAFQNSINPDGTTNQAKLMQNLAADPQAAQAAQASAQAGQTLSHDEYGQHMTRLSYAANAGAGLLAQYGGAPPTDAIKSLYDRAVQSGVMTPQDEAQVMQGYSNDPAQNGQIMRQRMLQNFSAQSAMTAALPAPTATNTGGTTVFRDANPLTNQGGLGAVGTGFTNTPGPQFINTGEASVPTTGGAPMVQPAIPNALSPSEKSTPTTIGMTPSGAPIVGTRQQFIDKATGSQQGGLGNGRFPTALLNPNKPGAAPAPPAATTQPAPGQSAPAQGIVTGLSPAQTAAQTETGTKSAAAFDDITTQGQAAQGQSATLGNMLADAQQFDPGMTKFNDFKTFLTRQTPAVARAFNISPDKVAANESFDKLASQIAGSQGAGSDARLAVAQNANPSSHLSAGGVDQILRQLQGNADYLQARQTLAAQYPDKSDRQRFESTVGKSIDPRAFQFARMTGPQQVAYAKSLSPTDQQTVHAAYLNGLKMGLIHPQAPAAAPVAPPAAAPAAPASVTVPIN